MDHMYLVRFVQSHESFRKPELDALAIVEGIDLEWVVYGQYSPFAVIRLVDIASARRLVRRSILTKGIYELWGSASSFAALHDCIRQNTSSRWPLYVECSFKFSLDIYSSSRCAESQRALIEQFEYLSFKGPVSMTRPDEEFVIFEDYDWGADAPKQVHFGRYIGKGGRDAIQKYSLKKRKYISTTSMDAELALLTANLALAGTGKLFYDPFVGTGSLPIACSHFGTMTLGSDIDGRTLRGKGGKGVASGFEQYGLDVRWLGSFIGDVTFNPLRGARVGIEEDGEDLSNGGPCRGGWLDGLVCDPPYGVREGLKVLGSRDGGGKEIVWIDGIAAHLKPDHIPPKRPYPFEAMLADILSFAASTLVPEGRISLWVPTANDEAIELEIPQHRALQLVTPILCHSCYLLPVGTPLNAMNNHGSETDNVILGSRRLLTYRRKRPEEVIEAPILRKTTLTDGLKANDLNNFRRRYFLGFKEEQDAPANGHEIFSHTGGSSELPISDVAGKVDVRTGPLTLEEKGSRRLGEEERT